ncbi:MAG TPA: NADH-quinone oxidoreductase subunit N [Solirubrobacteraceae bacterium]|nr:NADH-quinone oxidoreductase subunit N [Solirubrobacteraceae bacterium]
MNKAHFGVLVARHGQVHGPHISWTQLSPYLVLGGGALIVLLVGLLRSEVVRRQVVPLLSLLALGGAIGTEIWRFGHETTIIAGSMRVDHLALLIDLICAVAAIAAVLMSWRAIAPRQAGQGEYHSLLLFSVFGMAILASAQDVITLFLGLEMLSIPLYVLCASEHRREGSLESGLKYLVIGSVGSATLAYGLAMVYGATGQTGFGKIAEALLHHGLTSDPLLLTGLGLVIVGFAFKASVAPFHQWTPDVYEGAPTPITAFMATATKAAALAIFLRFFDVAAFHARGTWAPAIAVIAAVTIIVGNAGALPQTSMKRMLGYSGVAQAGYMLSGVVVASRLGVSSTVLYLGVYLGVNLAAFAVIHARERETGDDQLSGLAGLGSQNPWLAWPLTIGMLGLAGIPGTVGFVGKFQLIHALANGNYIWLAIVLVVGSMISLGYYLRVVAAIWMSPPASLPERREMRLAPIAGGSPELDDEQGASANTPGEHEPDAEQSLRGEDAAAGHAGDAPMPGTAARASIGPVSLAHPELTFVAVVFAAASVVFGIIPEPMFHLAAHAASLLGLR